jgi:membrane-bound serine protease (ClpP class)
LFGRNRLFGSLALETVESFEDGYTSSDSRYLEMVGKKGIAHTILRPAGKVMIDGEIYDATALSGYIEKGETIEVARYETMQLFVRKSEI